MRPETVVTEGLPGLIGNTPLVRLPGLGPGAAVYAKCEQYNPGGSLEDRAALAHLDGALARGELTAGGTVVATGCGNFALALALVGKARHVRVIIAVPELVTGERVNLLRSYGAEVVR